VAELFNQDCEFSTSIEQLLVCHLAPVSEDPNTMLVKFFSIGVGTCTGIRLLILSMPAQSATRNVYRSGWMRVSP
jgi:hypothetical protein